MNYTSKRITLTIDIPVASIASTDYIKIYSNNGSGSVNTTTAKSGKLTGGVVGTNYRFTYAFSVTTPAEWKFKYAVFDQAGNLGTWSAEATVDATDLVPTKPSALKFASYAQNALVLQGTASGTCALEGLEPEDVEYYIVKRDTTVVAYTLTQPGTISIPENFAALGDGTYAYTVTPMSAYGEDGTPSEALSITVVSGAVPQYPAFNPTSLTVTPAALGAFTVSWKYQNDPLQRMPSAFKVYWSKYVGEAWTNWAVDGTVAYVATAGTITHTSAKFSHGDQVMFKVQAIYSTFEKYNNNSVQSTADTTGPTLDPAPTITAVVS